MKPKKQLTLTEQIDQIRCGHIDDPNILVRIADTLERSLEPKDQIIFMDEIRGITGLSANRIYVLRIEDPTFPVKCRRGGHKLYAIRQELVDWFLNRKASAIQDQPEAGSKKEDIHQQLLELLDIRRRNSHDNPNQLNADIAELADAIYKQQAQLPQQ